MEHKISPENHVHSEIDIVGLTLLRNRETVHKSILDSAEPGFLLPTRGDKNTPFIMTQDKNKVNSHDEQQPLKSVLPSNEGNLQNPTKPAYESNKTTTKLTPWDITGLEHFFHTATLPTEPVRIDQCTVITNIPGFIDSHMAVIKAQNGKPTFLPYLERLQQLKEMINNN